MLCATMTGKVGRKPVPPLSGVCSWASVIRTRQGVGSKNFCICVIVRFCSLLPLWFRVSAWRHVGVGVVKEF